MDSKGYKVIIAGKMPPKISRNTGKKYQSLLLMDPQGNKIQGTLWEQSINAYEDDLIPTKTYLISNAHVRIKPPQHDSSGKELQWTINQSTRVELIEEDYKSFLFSKFTFTPFEQLANYVDERKKTIGIIGAAIDIQPKRLIYVQGLPIYVQDIVLMNKEFETVLLTVWDAYVDFEGVTLSQQIAQRPIVIGRNLVVTSFNGLSVNTQHDSYFYINGDFQEVEEFKSWVAANASKINDFLGYKLREIDGLSKVSKLTNQPYVDINEIYKLGPTIKKKVNLWVKAKAHVLVRKSSFWYLACNICNRGSSADNVGDIFHCRYCKSVSAITIARARADVELQDSRGKIQGSMMGAVAEKFFQCSAESMMMNNTSETKPIDSAMRLHIAEDHDFYLKVMPIQAASVDSGKFVHSPTYHFKLEIINFTKPSLASMIDATPTYMEDETPNEKKIADTAPPSPSAKRALFQEPIEVNNAKKKIEKDVQQGDISASMEKVL